MDYYAKGEERFGYFTSRIYAFSSSHSKYMEALYGWVVEDVVRAMPRSVLDVGTGPGIVPIGIARSSRIKVYAIDPSVDMIHIAKRKAKGLDNIFFAVGSSRRIPFKEKFDMIISSISMHHWRDKAGSLSYLSKFLNTRGQIRVYEVRQVRSRFASMVRLFSGSHSMTERELLRLGRKAKLRVKRISTHKGFIIAVYAK